MTGRVHGSEGEAARGTTPAGVGGQGGSGHSGASSERWLLTYADLITLLMVFFIVLYAMSELDKGKFERLAAYLAAAFGSGPAIVQPGGIGPGFLPPRPGDLRERQTLGEAATDPLQELGAAIRADLLHDGRFTVRVGERGLTISLVGSAAFDSGTAEIRTEFLPVLDTIAGRLRELEQEIAVEGFTDTDPIRTAAYPSNWYLSTARAIHVRDYLESRGIRGERMIVVGYGDTRPLWSNDTEDGKARNRRVDLVVLRQKRAVDPGQEI